MNKEKHKIDLRHAPRYILAWRADIDTGSGDLPGFSDEPYRRTFRAPRPDAKWRRRGDRNAQTGTPETPSDRRSSAPPP